MKRIFVYLLLTSVILLSGCQTSTAMETPLPVPSETSLPPTLEATMTETIQPSATMTVTMTQTSTPAATATQTPTITPTPFMGFEESKLNSHEANGDLYLFIFGVPGVSQPYYATIEKNPFSCNVDARYPDILICSGYYFEFAGEYVDVKFYQDETKTDLVYEDFYFSGPTEPAYIIVYAPRETWCENRGMNVNCETEYRQYDGETCMASTCYDDCGYYYSIDTCPYNSDEFRFMPAP